MDTLVNKIIELSQSSPDKLAVAFKDDALTYKSLSYLAAGVSEVLKKMGVRPDDRVVFSATSKVETIVIYLGIHMAEAVAVFVDKNATAQSMVDLYETSNGTVLLTNKPINDASNECNVYFVKEIIREAKELSANISDIEKYVISPRRDSIAEILFTTGTTGKPKGVMLSYNAVLNIMLNTIEGIGINMDDVELMPLPLNHSFPLRVARAVLFSGATLVLQNGFTFSKDVEYNIKKFGCNAMACVPASYEVMRGQMQDKFTDILGNLRFIEFGAGALSIQQRKTITTLIPSVTIYNTWGSSETGGAIFCNVSEVVKDERYIGTLGKPLEERVKIKIIDSYGQTIESSYDNPGRLAVKGEMLMTGYWHNEKETLKTLVEDWLITGDMAYEKDGYVFMLGRADNIINVGGEKVSPIEVENYVCQFPGIKECACLGVDDPAGFLGQIPILFVVGNSGVTEKGIRVFLSGKIEKYKIPAEYRFIDKLPRNRMQKVDYQELKKIYVNSENNELYNDTVKTILARQSIRNFTNKEIPKDVLEMILKCGYSAPSGHNMQSWRFTVLTSKEDIERLKIASRETAKANGVYFHGFKNPKVLILVSNDKRNPNGCQDASCAAENIMLAAASYGIGSVWLNFLMTLREKMPVKNILDQIGLPDNHVIWATVALGYPAFESERLKKNDGVVMFVE